MLSGFVLGESLRRCDHLPLLPRLAGFIVRRLGRIVPVMWASLAFAALVLAAAGRPALPGTTGWFSSMFPADCSPTSLVLHALALRNGINGVLWSVHIELAMALILPLTMLWVIRSPLRADLVVLAGLLVLSRLAWDWHPKTPPVLPDLPRYAYCFFVGLFLPKLLALPAARHWLRQTWLVVVSLVLLVIVETAWVTRLIGIQSKYLVDTAVAAQLVVFAVLSSGSNKARFLEAPVLVWLGDISYSLYAYALTFQLLTGFLVLTSLPAGAVGDNNVATLATLAIAVATTSLAVALAALSFEGLERPWIARSRALAERVEEWRSREAVDDRIRQAR